MRMFLFHIWVCVLVACCLSACRKAEQHEFTVGVSLCNDDAWHQELIKDLKHEALFYPDMKLDIKENKLGDDRAQIDNIQAFIRQKMDLIVVSAGNASLITPVVQEAHRAGIPVIILDQKVETGDYAAYVGGDNYMIGHQIGLLVVNRLKGKGNVVEIRGRVESLTDIERHKGFTDVLSRYPQIRIVAEERADFNTELAERKMDEILAKGEAIDIIFAMDDLTAKGVYNAYRKAGLPRPFTIGVDALAGEGGGIDQILKEQQDISFIYPTGGEKVLDIANRIFTGKPYSKNNILSTGIADRSNALLLQQQKAHFYNEQQKSARMNDQLTDTLHENYRQRLFLITSITVLLLIIVLLVIAIRAYRSKSKAQKRLAEQNERLETVSAQLEEAVKAKLTFFTNISHEFKTPLSLMIDPLKSVLVSGELSEQNRYKLELACRNSTILLDLISQIIDFNKYETYTHSLQYSRSDLKTFISGLNVLFRNLAVQNQVDFRFEPADDDFSVCFDRAKIERVYLNILSNAFRHVPQRGVLRVSLNRVVVDGEPFARIEIGNNGLPIPEDQIDAIFDRFYQAGGSDTGSGIGLALANVLVRLHNGSITACNREGEVVFTVLLPFEQKGEAGSTQEESSQEEVVSVPAPDRISEETPADDGAGKKYTVLIIDDNDDVRGYLKLILDPYYRVIDSPDGLSGLEKARNYQPDAIISDVMMPGMDGLELCKTLKETVSTCHIPVILLTARSMPAHEIEGIENGADSYITKPFDSELLKLRLRKLIENRRKMIEVFNADFMKDTRKDTLGDVQDAYMNRFQEYVLGHIGDSSLNVEAIAADFGESYVQMYRRIKSLTGQTPSELIKIIRLKYARQLLGLKTRNVAEVAYEAGFSTPSYFTRCFREFYKESPSDYMKRL